MGHLSAGELGTIPIDVKQGMLSSDGAIYLVDQFNRRTGLHVEYDRETGKLNYHINDESKVTEDDIRQIIKERGY